MEYTILELQRNKVVVSYQDPNGICDYKVTYKLTPGKCCKDVFNPGDLYGHDSIETGEFFPEDIEYHRGNFYTEEFIICKFDNLNDYNKTIDFIIRDIENDYINCKWGER